MNIINNNSLYIDQFNKLNSEGYFDKPLIGAAIKDLYKNYPILMKEVDRIKNTFNLTRVSEALYWIKNNYTEYPHCQYHTHEKCNDHPKFINYFKGYRKGCPFCGRKNPDILQKQKDGLIKKYGVDNIMDLKEFRDKRTKNAVNGWGFANKDFQNNFKKKMIEKYGVENAVYNSELLEKSKINKAIVLSDPIKRQEIKNKKQQTEIERYGDLYVRTIQNKHKSSIKRTNNTSYQDYINRMNNSFKEFKIELLEPITWEQDLYSYKCTKCNTIYNTNDTKLSLTRFREGKRYWCPKCYNIPGNCSISEYEVGNFISENISQIKIEHNRRDLIPNNYKEIDLYFPDYNIGIEFCGMLYHATFPYGLNGKGLSSDYHQDKFLYCLQNNIKLITIFECEWMSMNNRQQIKKRLLEYFNIFEQETNFEYFNIIDKNTASNFLSKNRYWCFNIDNCNEFVGLYNKYDVIVCILLRINNTNDYMIYKSNGIKINNFNDFLKNNNYNNIIQDNRYPLLYNDIHNNLYYDSYMWEYHDGWCSNMYTKYPDNNVKNIRKINDCGYSKIVL